MGKAAHPSYILITDNMIEMRDVSKYWGLDVLETVQQVCKDASCQDSVSCIGPAGERVLSMLHLCLPALLPDVGAGCCIRLKNIKAIAVRGILL